MWRVWRFRGASSGVSGFLGKFARVQNDLDGEALGTLTGKLEEASQAAGSKVLKNEAFSRLRSLGEGLSVGASGPMPGHIHLSSCNGGGYSGRPTTFIVGLDQGTFPGTGRQDPILLDEEREAISSDLFEVPFAINTESQELEFEGDFPTTSYFRYSI